MTQESRRIRWYRSPVADDELRKLYRRSGWLAWGQTLGYLGLICLTAGLALYSFGRWPWYITVAIVFCHGTFFAFQINAVHELGHLTVFESRRLNQFFMLVFSFLGWINPFLFFASHQRHHHSTLHPPDDLEVVVPWDFTRRDFLQTAFVNYRGIWGMVRGSWRMCLGRFEGEWELKLFPAEEPARRKVPVAWARFVLAGHCVLVAFSLAMHWWLVPIVVTLAPNYGGWLFMSCNHTQHIGLPDEVEDFRLCCRTFVPNAFVRFLYWHMNFHIEHHMYVGVPCYRLGRLHRLIRNDLPVCPRGILATWREINSILVVQRRDPSYRFIPALPTSTDL